MASAYTLPSDVAREWANKRWRKPNAKQLEARVKSQARINEARVDGDLAMLAVALGETFKLARAVYGQRQRLLDDRPLAGRDTPSLGGGWEGGGAESRGTFSDTVESASTFSDTVLTPSEILALECFGMEEEAWRDSKAALANSSGTQPSGLSSKENDSRQNAKPRGPSGPGADGASKKKRKKRKRRRISDSGKQGNGKGKAAKSEQRFC